MMKRKITYRNGWCIVAILCTAISVSNCGDKMEAEPAAETPHVIYMNPMPPEPATTRALVGSSTDLQSLCTPESEDGGGQAIGFWADYVNPDGTVNKNVFDANQTQLTYYAKTGGNPYSNWNYSGQDLVWAIGGSYRIRAFYPQRLHTLVKDPPTSATLFTMEYNTYAYQEDLLVAYNHVHTVDPVSGTPSIAFAHVDGNIVESTETTHATDPSKKGYNQEYNLNTAIPLQFQHSLAAIRVQIGYDYQEEDVLTSVRFENENTGGLATVGVLIYGEDSGHEPLVSPTQLQLENQLSWLASQTAVKGQPFYEWSVSQDGAEPNSAIGIPFGTTINTVGETVTKSQVMAVAYSDKARNVTRTTTTIGSGMPDIVTGDDVVPVAATPLVVEKEYAPYYNENDGWVLVIPQSHPTQMDLIFTTAKLGEIRVRLPQKTGTLRNGLQDLNGTWICNNYRYTYTLMIKYSSVEIGVTIEPWNEYFAVEEIDFNEDE